ncbi:thiol-disulfide oxidoreductase DCC family protein [Neobacillus mesonae]|uniref:Thiol-disulfide oxidoreductase n=1 Tax=Neobacillus mesonae TaxID=1193713 RepID=A0A3Q9QYW9_9BACI|nr:thiol-disulfide oxidoreductase DCC family protein [Neobacillus mesonae]AZU62052.1 thiol-disulfide oxidoreductase [Neobacillus mesonae]
MQRIILFDGVCNFCNSSVQFIIKRDPKGHFKFASLQGEIGQQLLNQHGLNSKMDSFVLIEDDNIFFESTAVLRVCRKLKGGWKLLAGLFIVPSPLRNSIYKIIAKNRYKWFGKKDSCMLPRPEWRNRFLD